MVKLEIKSDSARDWRFETLSDVVAYWLSFHSICCAAKSDYWLQRTLFPVHHYHMAQILFFFSLDFDDENVKSTDES